MKIPAAFAALSLLVCSATAFASDAAFVEKAAQGGMAEIEAGQLAANKATSAEVRDFGLLMVKDHTAANQKLAQIAKTKNIPMPETYGDKHRASLRDLQSVDGAGFDQAYMAQMVKDHEETVQLLKSEIASGQDPQIKAYAADTLPTVEGHLREAYRLTGREGAKAPSSP